jgi:pimeloyl-ACP methyl ester carboxylesterase
VDFVKKETGAASVAWVGHSLGGAIAMCYLERTPDAPIGCLVAVASPVVVPKPGTFFQENIKDFRLAMTAINNRWQALAGAITLGRFKTPIDVVFYNEKNMAPLTIQLMYLRIAEDVPKPVVDQLLKMAETGELISPDGKFNYSKEVSRLTLPVFFIAGKVDHSADPEAVHYAYERVSSKDKTFRLFGLAWGDSIDYGHDDLILGKRSREEVYPVIEKWLQTRARLLAPASRPQKE